MSKNTNANHARWHEQDRVAAEKSAILDYMRGEEKVGFKSIQQATGIRTVDLTNRIMKLKEEGRISYVGRSRFGKDTESFYAYAYQDGESTIPKRLREYPSAYLTWGGWTA